MAMLLAACGGDAGEVDQTPTSTTAAQDGATDDTEPDDSTDAESTTTTGAEAGEEEPPPTSAGTAVLTIGGTTYEFSGLTCFYDEAAAEAYGSEDTSFVAGAGDADEGVTVAIGTPLGPQFVEVVYRTGEERWWMVDSKTEGLRTFEDGQIIAEGEFEHTIDRAETGTIEQGTLEASCG